MPSEKVLLEKQKIVADLTEKLKAAATGIFVDYRGLTVAQDTELRSKLRAAGIEYKVVKNTLCRFAIKEIGLDELDPILNGPTSLAISNDDPVAPAKVLAEFAKKNDKLEIKAGFMDGKVMTLDEIKRLADTPSREVLLATILSSLNAPVSKLVRTLQAIVDTGVEPAELAAKKNAGADMAAEAPAETAEAAAEEPATDTPAADAGQTQ
jgi:large subunit ribosomal protein L10